MFNKLFIPLLLLLVGCANNEITITAEEYNQLRPTKKRMTVFDKMKEYSDEELNWKRENEILQVVVDKNNQIFVRGQLIDLKDLKGIGKRFFYDYEKVSDSSFADEAMISLRSNKRTKHQVYLAVYNELRQIYSELWEEEAQATYYTSFENLKMTDKKVVRQKIPLNLSESEPTEF